MSRTTIQHDKMLSPLFAKVVFDNRMSDMKKSELKKDFDKFVEQVKKQIDQVEGVPFK